MHESLRPGDLVEVGGPCNHEAAAGLVQAAFERLARAQAGSAARS